MNTEILTTVRSSALELLAEWLSKHDGEVSKQDFLEDLQLYSPTTFDEHHERHDHHEFVFHPSIGDELGYWTLYVIVASGGGYGAVDEDMRKAMLTDVIRAMWQVADTMPVMIYSLEEEFTEDSTHTISTPHWHNVPEEDS
jgi:hypothetical protein